MSLEVRIAILVGLLVALWATYLLARTRPRDLEPLLPDQDGRRRDVVARTRLLELERRYRSLVTGIVGAFVTLGIAVTLALALQGAQADDVSNQADELQNVTQRLERVVAGQQASRVRSLHDACIQRNDDHRDLTAFVTRVAPTLHDAAARAFPAFPAKATEHLCADEARRRVKAP